MTVRQDELLEWRLCALVVARDALLKKWAEERGLPPPKTYLQELQEYLERVEAINEPLAKN